MYCYNVQWALTHPDLVQKHREKERNVQRHHRPPAPDKAQSNWERWSKAHPGRHNMFVHNWAKANPGSRAAKEAKRRAQKLQATPKWLTKEQIEQMKQFYINCPRGYHVDHVYPLKGKSSCGLHVPWNLQYLTAKENESKGNKIV